MSEQCAGIIQYLNSPLIKRQKRMPAAIYSGDSCFSATVRIAGMRLRRLARANEITVIFSAVANEILPSLPRVRLCQGIAVAPAVTAAAREQ